MKILAIDPGYERLGVAILEKIPNNKEVLVFSDCFKTSSKLSHDERLKNIGAEIERLIQEYQPEVLAIETLFFQTNTKTALKVAEARGVILYEAAKIGLKIREFNPLEIKVAVTGYGKSDKNQVTTMVKRLIKINKEPKHDDEYDAIAVGLTCLAIK